MVLNREGLAWIGRRPEIRGDWWQMPQGGIDEGEDPERAALRELHEETGIRTVEVIAAIADWLTYDLPVELQGKSWAGRYRGQKQKWFAVRFLGSDDEINLTPPAGHKREFETWRWAPLAELPRLIVPFKRGVYETVVAEFGRHAHPI
jgi:putative (di)nucleoside polyphosphate hydrolase